MKKLVFELETVTPVFCSGANSRKAELRPASFKGMMRYWYRAMIAENDLEDLHKKENKIFGSIKQSSSFGIRIKGNHPSEQTYVFTDIKKGIKYLWYSIEMQQNKDGKALIPANYNFKLELFSRDNDEALIIATLSLWIMIQFGGVGSRSRRGAGNLRITKIKDKHQLLKDYQLIFVGNNLTNYQDYLLNNLDKIKDYFKQGKTNKYSNLAGITIWFIDKEFNGDYQEALDFIGTKFQNFRSKYENCDRDYKVFKDFLIGEENDGTIDKIGFGLPLMYRYRSLKGKGGIITATGRVNRRSSPLIIKLVKIENSYYPMLIRLSGEFLPNNKKLYLKEFKNRNNTDTKPLPEIDIIDKFINTLENRIEVRL